MGASDAELFETAKLINQKLTEGEKKKLADSWADSTDEKEKIDTELSSLTQEIERLMKQKNIKDKIKDKTEYISVAADERKGRKRKENIVEPEDLKLDTILNKFGSGIEIRSIKDFAKSLNKKKHGYDDEGDDDDGADDLQRVIKKKTPVKNDKNIEVNKKNFGGKPAKKATTFKEVVDYDGDAFNEDDDDDDDDVDDDEDDTVFCRHIYLFLLFFLLFLSPVTRLFFILYDIFFFILYDI